MMIPEAETIRNPLCTQNPRPETEPIFVP